MDFPLEPGLIEFSRLTWLQTYAATCLVADGQEQKIYGLHGPFKVNKPGDMVHPVLDDFPIEVISLYYSKEV